MISKALFLSIVVATLLETGNSELSLDKGSEHGLRPGDSGTVFYLLEVEGREVRIEVARLRLTDCQGRSCRAALLSGKAQAGYQVEFELSQDRGSLTEWLKMADQHLSDGDLAGSRRYLEKIRRLLPDDPLAAQRVALVEERLAEREADRERKEVLNYYRTVAADLIESGDYALAWSYLQRIGQENPDDRGLSDLERKYWTAVRSRMIQVPAGEYLFGENRPQASYYNQQPRFAKTLKTFWIDRAPVPAQRLQRPTASGPGGVATKRTFGEALKHCMSLGMHLPTEFQWEAAARGSKFGLPSGLAEWTDSWYLPYPGNRHPEPDYGQKFKVIRGHDSEGKFSPTLRFYQAPGERAADVGFRCVSQ